jgi:hypothetical protein
LRKTVWLLITLTFALCPSLLIAQADKNASQSQSTGARDGSRDFDPLIGSWKYHLKRRLRPLTGSNEWVEFEGSGSCRKIFDGSQIDQGEWNGPTGRIVGLTLRVYNPTSRQWRLYWSNQKVGVLDPPQIGEFKNGVGEFYAQDTYDGKTVLVRFRWTNLTTDTPHFEQSFSDDGGKNWEVNWITDQTRVPDPSEKAQ